jgi:anti-anti-sigma factor
MTCDGQSKISIEGALDAMTIRDIRPVMEAIAAQQPRRVTVDLEMVTLMDSAGACAIVSLFKRITMQGGELVVANAHDQPLTVLKVLKLDTVFGL